MSDQNFYLTTAIPYVNAKPHLGHVLEWFQADAIARQAGLQGKKVEFAAGSDENSLKNVQAAEKAKKETQAWLDEYSQIFKDAYRFFNIDLTRFQRGSDATQHWPGVQELWRRCDQSGDIYKKTYQGLYCVGCEAYYTPEELINGKCPEHLVEPEVIEEENYFFKLSKYQDQILQLIKADQVHVISDQYKKEVIGFIEHGLEDFSISRSQQRARGVGVPVPNDPTQVMYVWFDALSIYLTAVGWGHDPELFEKTWPADLHIIGKGILRFHAVYWIGMLLSAQLELPKNILVHGYITANGQKMSKSLGNVIDPFELVEKYGLEPVRYYLLRHIPTNGDGDFSTARFEELYTAFLANGLGNVCSRVAKLAEKAELKGVSPATEFDPEFTRLFTEFQVSSAADWVFSQVEKLNEWLSVQEPWKKSGSEQSEILETAIQKIVIIAFHLQPFMPETAKKIIAHFTQSKITAIQPLFPRLPQS